MTPSQLRAVTGTPASAIAKALGISLGSLQILEATPTEAWTLAQLRTYVGACRCDLELAVVDRVDGERTPLA